MTTGNEDADAGAATGRRSGAARAAARGGVPLEAAVQVALIVGLVAFVAVMLAAQLVLNNTYGPLADHQSAGRWAPLGCGAVAGLLVVVVTVWVARRSAAAVLTLWAVVAASGWVLFPQPIDVSESWVPRPNERYACTGWEFRHYPPGTADGSATTYCIGLEHRIADG